MGSIKLIMEKYLVLDQQNMANLSINTLYCYQFLQINTLLFFYKLFLNGKENQPPPLWQDYRATSSPIRKQGENENIIGS